MRLTGKEINRLTIFTLAELARRRRARGRRLNAPEAVAIVCDEIFEMAWDGLPLAEVVDRAGALLDRDEVMEGVPAIVPRIEVDALFPSGTLLVVVERPFGPPGDVDAAPGAVKPADEPVTVNPGAVAVNVIVENTADVPIEVTSHFHFFEANRHLTFDRKAAYGMRLDVPAGTSVRWRPGERKEVELIPIEGDGHSWGFGGLVDGPLDVADAAATLEEAIKRGYQHGEEADAD
jgi:urease subunit gamma/beta